METPHQRIASFWKDFERFGSVWTLEVALVLHFGRNQELMLPHMQEFRNVNYGHDPCLPQEDHPDYAFFETFVDAAERIIESRIWKDDETLDDRLCGYPGGRRADTLTLNCGWSQPFQRIEGSGDLKDELIAELKAMTMKEDLVLMTGPTPRARELHA